jgi:LmbE family N-acetylglucosaminyl deacetylase
VLQAVLDLARSERGAVVLGLSAHPDDLEIGCGGTLLRLAAEHPDVLVHSVVLTGSPDRLGESRAAVAEITAGSGRVEGLGLDDGSLPGSWQAAKDRLRAATADLRPAVVLCPSSDDAHQDHRLVAELAWQLFRDTLVLEYEIPKWEGDLVRRNAYVELSDDVMLSKLRLLREHFRSQAGKPWFDDDVFRGLARLRGVECGRGWAEAFTARKVLLVP